MAENRFSKFATSANRFAQFAQGGDFASRAAGMSHQQMVDEYRKTRPGDPWGDFLAAEIQKPIKGETPEQASVRAGGVGSTGMTDMSSTGKAAATFLQGVPFAGEYTDEALSRVAPLIGPNDQETALRAIREGRTQFEQDNPKTSLGLKVGGGLTGTAVAAGLAPFNVVGSGSLPMQMLRGAGITGALGAGEGAVSGYGAGEDNQSRNAEMLKRMLIGGVVGTATGGLAPAVMAGGKAAANSVLDMLNLSKNAKQAGLTKPSYDILTRAMESDGALQGQGLANIRAAGPDAMPVDAGPNAQALLDATIQNSGAAGTAARQAVEQRAANSANIINDALDTNLGKPAGLFATAKDISMSTAPARDSAYKQAYSQVIDYATPEGAAISEALDRVPRSLLGRAMAEANDAMRAEGIRNMQPIEYVMDAAGNVTSFKPLNVQQLDEVKKALGKVGSEEVDNLGRATAVGMRAQTLSRKLRDAITGAVPDYANAVKLGGDKIAEDNALRLGSKLFDPSMTREAVKEATDGISAAEQVRLAAGLRQRIDDTMANVSRAVSDGNMDAREAIKAVKDFSSRANREKLVLALGQQKADNLLREIDRATVGLELRAAVAQNSKTFARTALNEGVDNQVNDGIVNAVRSGEPLNVGKRAWQSLFGASPADKVAQKDKVYAEIAKFLTNNRGADAEKAFQNLVAIAQKSPQNKAMAETIGRMLGLGFGGAAYQAGTKGLETLTRGR